MEIRESAAQIRPKTAINDKRRGTSRPESRDSPSRWRPSRAPHVTHRIALTPIPGTTLAAGRSPHPTVRGRDAPPHTPHADIRNFPSGSPLLRTCAPLCPSQLDPFLAPIVIDTLPSVTSAPTPTLYEPAAAANPRPRNKTTAKWAQKANNRREAKVLRQKIQYEHLLAPTHVFLPNEAPEGPPTAAPGEGRSIGTPVGNLSGTPLGNQDSTQASTNLAVHIIQDTALFKELGCHQFVAQRRSRSNFASLDKVDHPAQRLLKFYKERGAPIKMATKPWSRDQISAALSRGAHRLCMEHTEFLHGEFHDMILKSQ